MRDRLRHHALFALYQVTLVLGIVLLPLAVALARLGLRLPLHRVVGRLGDAVDRRRSH